MSYNGSGTFNINTAGQPVVTGTVISSTAFNALTADLGTGLSTAITKNGQTTVTANIPFNGYKLTGIAVATASGDALSYGQAATVSALTDSALTSGRVPYASTAGLFVDSANLTFNGTTLTAAGFSGPLNGTVGATTANTGAFTTLSSTVGAGTSNLVAINHGAGTSYISGLSLGVNGGSGNAYIGLGGSAYSNLGGASNISIWNMTTGGVSIAANSAQVGLFSSTGLAVTGTFSATGLTLDSSGNLGLGVTANTTNIGGTYSLLSVGKSGGSGIFMGQSDSTASGSTVAQFFGKTTGASGYQLVGGMLIATDGTSTTDAVGRLQFYTATGGSASERMRIDSSGNVLVGTTSQYGTAKITVSSSATDGISSTQGTTGGYCYVANALTNSGTFYFNLFKANGTVTGSITSNGTTTTYGVTSDYRLKTVTGAVTGQGSRIDALKPIDYLWTEGGQQARGFLAHEFQAVYSNSVTGEKDAVDADGNPKYQAMQAATSEVIADLVAEIQSLRARVAQLETKGV